MTRFSPFLAISAIYFGLASAVGAQPVAASSAAQGAARVEDTRPKIEDTRRDRFEHPMLERHPSHDMRPSGKEGERIQRRGLHDVRQDGEIRRNPLPGAADAPNSAPRAGSGGPDTDPAPGGGQR